MDSVLLYTVVHRLISRAELLQAYHLIICLSPYLSHSQQAVQDDKYSPEDYDVFNIAGRTCIEEGHSAQVLSILVDEKNQVCVWILIHPSRLYTLSHPLLSLVFVLTAQLEYHWFVNLLQYNQRVQRDTAKR